MLIYSIVSYLVFLIIAFYYAKPKKLGFKKTDLVLDVIYALLFLSLMLVVTIIIGVIGNVFGMKADMEKVSEVIQKSVPEYLIITVLIGSIVEEIFFRGFLQPKIGLIPASVLFGYMHVGYGSITEIIAATLLGVLLGALYEKRRTIYSPIMAHLAFNLIMIMSTLVVP